MKQKFAFIDRDGTIVEEPPITFQINSLEELRFKPGVIKALYALQHELGYVPVMVSNQDGLGTPANPLDIFNKIQHKIIQVLEDEGITFHAIHIDDSYPEDQKPTRKPGTAMLTAYINDTVNVDMPGSIVIGDRATDVQLAKNLGCRAILLHSDNFPDAIHNCSPDYYAKSWPEIVEWLQPKRKASLHRKTHETDIYISLCLDGQGHSDIDTGLHFFNHMLEQLARHGCLDLTIKATGDLQVDEHHTIEDTAIVLGQAMAQALADKAGIERYGFVLPMDEAKAEVAIDFGGRPYLVWDATFARERIGDMPTEMFEHFFRSFADAARCNLHIKARGKNEHHKIEAIFKCFAKAIKMAVRKDNNSKILPSTKGIL